MVQKIFGLGIAGTGIVGVLVVAGIILNVTNVEPGTGSLAIGAGIGIGIILGLFGIIAVAKRVLH